MRFVRLSMHRPRHPLARALSLLVGVAVVGLLLMFGLVVAGVLLVGGGLLLALRHWRSIKVFGPATTTRRPKVLEGDFVVVQQGRPAR
jgi:hypothetical protein